MSPKYNDHLFYSQPTISPKYNSHDLYVHTLPDGTYNSSILYSLPSLVKLYFAQPQLIRTRQRYRGQKESYKFNLEIGQLRFDTIKLIEKYINMEAAHEIDISNLYDGVAFDNIQYTDYELSTPSDSDVLLEGIDSLSERVNRLTQRLKSLS